MTSKDVATVQIINKEDMGYDYPLEGSLEQFHRIEDDNKQILLVYVDEDKGILGYLHAQPFNLLYSEPLLNVLSVAVSSKAQKMGVGKQLMQAVEELAIKQDYQGIRLNTETNNTSAQAFYKKIGYETDMEQKRFYKHF